MSSRINVGWLALAFAWLIGVYQAGLRPDAVMAGFPVTLFLTLAGVTLLFSIAETNGTLDCLARRAIQLARDGVRPGSDQGQTRVRPPNRCYPISN